jgi:hypothetical protein
MNPAERQIYDRMLQLDRKKWNDDFRAGGGRLREPERFVPFPKPLGAGSGAGQTPHRPVSTSVRNDGSGVRGNTSLPPSQSATHQNSGEKIRGKGSPDKPFQLLDSADEVAGSSDEEGTGGPLANKTNGTYDDDDDDEEEPVEVAAGLLVEQLTLPTQTQRPQPLPQPQSSPARVSGNRVVAMSRQSGPTGIVSAASPGKTTRGSALKQPSPEDDRLLLPVPTSQSKNAANTKPKPTLMLDDDE